MNKELNQKQKSLYTFPVLLLLISLMPFLGSFALLYIVKVHREFFDGIPWLVMLTFYSITIFTMAFALTPTTFVAFVSGYVFAWNGFVPMVIAYLIASWIGLQVGKLLSKGFIESITRKENRWQIFIESMSHRMFRLVLFARLSPILPFAMINVALSSIKINPSVYLGGTLIGMLPRSFLMFWIGMNAGDLMDFFRNPSGEGLYKLLPFALILISLVGLIYITSKSWKESSRKPS